MNFSASEWESIGGKSLPDDLSSVIRITEAPSIQKCKQDCLKERTRPDPCVGFTYFKSKDKAAGKSKCLLKNYQGLKDFSSVYSARIKPCTITQQENCHEAFKKMAGNWTAGYVNAGYDYDFASESEEYKKGCYGYNSGQFAGHYFFGIGGTESEKSSELTEGRFRPSCPPKRTSVDWEEYKSSVLCNPTGEDCSITVIPANSIDVCKAACMEQRNGSNPCVGITFAKPYCYLKNWKNAQPFIAEEVSEKIVPGNE